MNKSELTKKQHTYKSKTSNTTKNWIQYFSQSFIYTSAATNFLVGFIWWSLQLLLTSTQYQNSTSIKHSYTLSEQSVSWLNIKSSQTDIPHYQQRQYLDFHISNTMPTEVTGW